MVPAASGDVVLDSTKDLTLADPHVLPGQAGSVAHHRHDPLARRRCWHDLSRPASQAGRAAPMRQRMVRAPVATRVARIRRARSASSAKVSSRRLNAASVSGVAQIRSPQFAHKTDRIRESGFPFMNDVISMGSRQNWQSTYGAVEGTTMGRTEPRAPGDRGTSAARAWLFMPSMM